MRVKDFPIDKFLYRKEENDKKIKEFLDGKRQDIPVIVRGIGARYKGEARNEHELLEIELDELYSTMSVESDFMYPTFLQPWFGTDIYALAYGCEYKWFDKMAPQSEAMIKRMEDVGNLRKADIENCELMQLILRTIKYMKAQTGNLLDISVTDTQSPNDIGSEIMDACEFITMCMLEPEAADAYLSDITDTLIRFTDMQIEAIGDSAVFPGHVMISHKDIKGVYLSDDNMAFLSPQIYESASLKFNNRISKHFGGVSIHSCGNWIRNAGLLLKTENLFMVDCSLGAGTDPNPLVPSEVRDAFRGSDVIIKAKLGIEDLENLRELVDPELKLVIEIVSSESIEEKSRLYNRTREFISRL